MKYGLGSELLNAALLKLASGRNGCLEPQALQVLAEGAAQVVALERELDRGLQEAQLVSGVVARALEAVAVQAPVLAQGAQAVRELDLAAGVARRGGQGLEDVGREDVAPDDGEVARRLVGRGL